MNEGVNTSVFSLRLLWAWVGELSSPSSVFKKPWLVQRVGDKDTERGQCRWTQIENKQKNNLAEVKYPQVGS